MTIVVAFSYKTKYSVISGEIKECYDLNNPIIPTPPYRYVEDVEVPGSIHYLSHTEENEL